MAQRSPTASNTRRKAPARRTARADVLRRHSSKHFATTNGLGNALRAVPQRHQQPAGPTLAGARPQQRSRKRAQSVARTAAWKLSLHCGCHLPAYGPGGQRAGCTKLMEAAVSRSDSDERTGERHTLPQQPRQQSGCRSSASMILDNWPTCVTGAALVNGSRSHVQNGLSFQHRFQHSVAESDPVVSAASGARCLPAVRARSVVRVEVACSGRPSVRLSRRCCHSAQQRRDVESLCDTSKIRHS